MVYLILEKLKGKRVYFFATVLFFAALTWFVLPPFSFPTNTIITIESGAGLHELSLKLKEDRVIRSPFWFRISAIFLGGERDMKAGEYYMSRPESVFEIAWRIFHGINEVEVKKVTIPEGYNVEEISGLFNDNFLFFEKREFKLTAKEGYLFPDTYFIPISVTASSVIKMLNDNFSVKVKEVQPEITASNKSLEEIIIMASILEGEARTLEDRKIVSGILWKRLKLGIALQVDATFSYVNGKTTKELTLDDLKIDSPYNTYRNRGLPPTPISNPGLESIDAAIHPTDTPYLYFLTGDDGEMYYSRTHDEHVEKKSRYIKR